mmetsp:Transcript_30127/g.72324  ORF Transcript_30127/g.72324 Transcript_30127/m.72324 type:complete len:96 (-) Transcript_30127:234-521(-)
MTRSSEPVGDLTLKTLLGTLMVGNRQLASHGPDCANQLGMRSPKSITFAYHLTGSNTANMSECNNQPGLWISGSHHQTRTAGSECFAAPANTMTA